MLATGVHCYYAACGVLVDCYDIAHDWLCISHEGPDLAHTLSVNKIHTGQTVRKLRWLVCETLWSVMMVVVECSVADREDDTVLFFLLFFYFRFSCYSAAQHIPNWVWCPKGQKYILYIYAAYRGTVLLKIHQPAELSSKMNLNLTHTLDQGLHCRCADWNIP